MAPTPAGTSRQIMYCLGCEYVLNGIDGTACPECGRLFSARDASSYATVRRRWYKKAFESTMPTVLSLLGAFNVFACIMAGAVMVAGIIDRSTAVQITAPVVFGCCAAIACACFKAAFRPTLPG